MKATKKTMKKIRSQEPNLPPSVVGNLAAMAGNHTLKVKGFTPIQWAYGVDPAHYERDELALDPLKVNKEIMEKSRKGRVNPEPRFIGPGRVALIEPAVLPEGRSSVLWVLIGASLWRCASLQSRKL